MDITKHKFSEPNPFSMAVDPRLLKEARERGFYGGNTPYNDLFSELFFNGGKVNFKKGLDKRFRNKAFAYLQCFMQSFEPSHQEKEAVCALLLSELCNE